MASMTQQEVYDVISQWTEVTPANCYNAWRGLYNWLPPDSGPAPANKWNAAAEIAGLYDGPVIT